MQHTLFLSHRLEPLVDRLIEECETNPIDPLVTRSILVANGQIKQWLFLEIAKRKGITMGLKALTLGEAAPKSSFIEIYGSIYQALQNSADDELFNYLGGKKSRLLHLTTELATLFFNYGRHGKPLFDREAKVIDWQHALLRKLFVEGTLRLPMQTLAEQEPFPLICFGIDYLPPLYWSFFFKAPSLSIYLFSPCQEFWEDLCTDRERRKLSRYWKKKGASEASRHQLDAYLRDAPPLLANWGKLGRETLKIFDTYSLQIEEVFPPLEPTSLLKQLQSDLLQFQVSPKREPDRSIQIFQTGSSRIKEIEHLREEILRLSVPYHEIAVLAPSMEPYVPLIEFVFADIPYRISGFDVSTQSTFRLGLSRLLNLGRWDAEKVLNLIETPSFYRKQGWDEDKLEIFRTWISDNHIKWGIDQAHCQKELVQTFGEKNYQAQGSWEAGLDRMLEAIIYLRPQQIQADLFEEFLTVILALKKISLTGERSPSAWADYIESLADQFLQPDFNAEADAAVHEAFCLFLRDLRLAQVESIPFEVIQKLLFAPCPGQLHTPHLHAIRFASLAEAAMLPARALFLIGMDEESFPRVKIPSSLDLLKRCKIDAPEQADEDRYLFLQTLFSAQETLSISYCHLSPDEGKPIGPSILVQELMSATGITPTLVYRPFLPAKKENGFWPDLSKCPECALPDGEHTISLSDLRALARHPWKFFLQKVHGIYLNEELEKTFALQKGWLLRKSLETSIEELFADAALPEGLFGEAIRLEVQEKAIEWQRQLTEWDLKPFTLVLRENCSEKQWEGGQCIVPPLEVVLNDRLKVKLVGEIKQASNDGLICSYEDLISGVLKAWPEALALALSLDVPQICMLKSGKKKSLERVEDHLKAFIAYYFRCLKAPSPLLPDWADPLLRKGGADLEKKMKRGAQFEDPVLEWVLARTELPAAQKIIDGWGPFLRESFVGLTALFPVRASSTK